MAEVVKKGTGESATQKIRISLVSRNAAAVEKVCTDLVAKAKEIQKSDESQPIRIAGPMRLPTRTLHHVTRKTPCGNGSNTWDRYEMKIYKRVVDVFAPSSMIRNLTAVNLESGVDIDVSVHGLN